MATTRSRGGWHAKDTGGPGAHGGRQGGARARGEDQDRAGAAGGQGPHAAAGADGRGLAEIARSLGANADTVALCVRRHREGGALRRGGRGRPRGAPRARARDEVHGVVDPPRGRPAPRPGAPLLRAARPRLRGEDARGARRLPAALVPLRRRRQPAALGGRGAGGPRRVGRREARHPGDRARRPGRGARAGRAGRGAAGGRRAPPARHGVAHRRHRPAGRHGGGASRGSATGAASSPGCRGPSTPGTPRGTS